LRSPSFLVVGLAAALSLSAAAVADSRPNIVLIVADDVGFSDFGAFGGEIDTPNIDQLADEGVRFSNFHAASSCAPTRAMLLTGLDSHIAGVGSMRELMPLSHRGKPGYLGVLDPAVKTLSEVLKDAGYRTSVAGKWHLGHEPGNLPPERGFDYSVIQAESGSDNFEMRPYLPMQAEVFWYENGQRMNALPEDFYSSRYFVDKTIAFLEESPRANTPDSPFFAYVAFQANHTPLQAPAHFIDAYRGRYIEGWADVQRKRENRLREMGLFAGDAVFSPGPTQAAWDTLTPEARYFEARRMQAYAGMATAMDYEIGRLKQYLADSGELSDTLFILLSDNGAVANEPYSSDYARDWLEKHYHREVESLGEKGSWVAAGSRWGVVSNTPLRDFKFFAGEGGVRVPLIIAGAGVAAQGAIYSEFTHVTDLVPTVLEAAGIRPPSPAKPEFVLEGVSLLPALAGGSAPLRSNEASTGYEFSGNAALFQGDYKLKKNMPPLGENRWQLFNLRIDPGETADLREAEPERFQRMLEAYAEYERRAGVLPIPESYRLPRQVAINSLLFVFLPRYLPYAAVLFLLLCGSYFGWRRWRARR
jgi:arylsulfatase A-like enzyme